MIPTSTKVYFAKTPADLRKSFDGLAALATSTLKIDPRTGAMFVFLNKKGNQVRVLFRDKDGWCLLSKRLDAGQFKPPTMRDGEFCWEASTEYLMTFLRDIQPGRAAAKKKQPPSIEHLRLVPPAH